MIVLLSKKFKQSQENEIYLIGFDTLTIHYRMLLLTSNIIPKLGDCIWWQTYRTFLSTEDKDIEIGKCYPCKKIDITSLSDIWNIFCFLEKWKCKDIILKKLLT